jgi:DNA excision repair protein ERCC-4
MIHALDSMRNLCEKVRRAICFKLPIAQYENDLDAMCALLDDSILDAAEVALAPDLEPATVLVDTREQRPFAPFLWQKNARVYLAPERFMLAEGDYSALGLETIIRIERKSGPDLLGSLFGISCDALGESAPNQERLRAECMRLQKYPRRYLVIECTQRDLVALIQQTGRRVDPVATIQLVESMAFDYDVPVRWCTNREAAEWFVGYVLSRAHTQATSATEAKKAVKRGLSLPWAYDIAKAVTKAADAIREGVAP